MDKTEPSPYFENREAFISIIDKFHWPYEDWMQDWPLEISEKIDLAYCLQEYPNLVDKDEKFLLMRGILYALNEVQEEYFELYSQKTANFLKRDFDIHSYTIHYWACYSCGSDGFRITPLMREICHSQ